MVEWFHKNMITIQTIQNNCCKEQQEAPIFLGNNKILNIVLKLYIRT